MGNGADLPALPADAKAIQLPENVGVSAGRNIVTDACTGDVILFLDDDAWYHDPAVGEYVAGRFAADSMLAGVPYRRSGRRTGRAVACPAAVRGRSWPFLAGHHIRRGFCAIRWSAYLEAGGLPDAFFFAHEEIDLSWRLIDRGLAGAYLLDWFAITVIRERSPAAIRKWLSGFAELTRAGRPPVI